MTTMTQPTITWGKVRTQNHRRMCWAWLGTELTFATPQVVLLETATRNRYTVRVQVTDGEVLVADASGPEARRAAICWLMAQAVAPAC